MTHALTRNVKINGIARKAATNSTVDVTLTGTAGTMITNGSVKDANGLIWNLSASITIDVGGSVTVMATCANSDAAAAVASSITKINTPTRGWMAVSNASAATVGSATTASAGGVGNTGYPTGGTVFTVTPPNRCVRDRWIG